VFSQETEKIFELKETHQTSYFYNTIVVDNKLFFGTSNGVQYYDNKTKTLKLINSNIVGAIDHYNGEFINIPTPIDNLYSHLLPTNYSKSKSNSLVYRSDIYVICRGVLFVFNLKSYNFKPFPSVRAISKNYIGAYGGIYSLVNNEKLEFPTYTNSFIREFDGVTFINWDGLSIIDKNRQRNFYASSGDGIEIKGSVIGMANDIEKIGNNSFLLFTSEGIYLFNDKTLNIKQVLSASKYGTLNFIRSEKDINGASRVFLHNDKTIFQYLTKTNEIINITSINEQIVDVFSDAASAYYIITGKDVRKIHLTEKKENYILFDNIILPNNIGIFKNFVFVSSDLGLHLFDLKTKTGKELIIKEEFNKNAFFIDNNKLYLGSINGLYELDNSTLTYLFNEQAIVQIEENIIIRKENLLIYGLLIILLGAAGFLLFRQKIKKINEKREKYKGINQAQINEYIVSNISSVSINSICNHFELPVNKLYNLLGKKKPGDLIREERLKIVKQMKIENKSIKEIAQATGFSTSYLKKLLSS
jgi:outer membrane protein assembly factor BamB